MKKLQNNFTTPEQSKKLLELGVPADSADMFYFAIGNSKENYDRGIFYDAPDVLRPGNILHELTKNTLPCWSVGRLIEIYNMCTSGNGIYIPRNHIVLDKVLIEFFGALLSEEIDFSKLEE